jgi:nucleoside-diphosphate-sugar epimerase
LLPYWRRVDVRREDEIEAIFSEHRPELVFHLAGVTGALREADEVVPSFRANALASVLLLAAAHKYSCKRFVYCGSMEEPLEGGGPPRPSSPYGAAKLVGTLYTRMYHEMFQLPTVVVRPFFVYGPGRQAPEKLVPYLMRTYLDGGTPRLSSPSRRMDWVFIDDVIEGLVKCAHAERAVGEAVDLGSGKLTSIGAVADLIRSSLGLRAEPVFQPSPARAEEGSPIADVERCCEILGWSPATVLSTGIGQTINWYREHL